MPILGVIASSKLTSTTTPSFESIASFSGGSTAITFSSIPNTYKHLQLRITGLDSGGSTGIGEWYIRLNGDTTAGNYWKMRYYTNNTTVTGSTGAVGSEGAWGTPTARSSCIQYAMAVIDIHDYANTSRHKDISMRGMGLTNTRNVVVGGSSSPYFSTSAISSVTIDSNIGAWTSASVFSLYGIKGQVCNGCNL